MSHIDSNRTPPTNKLFEDNFSKIKFGKIQFINGKWVQVDGKENIKVLRKVTKEIN